MDPMETFHRLERDYKKCPYESITDILYHLKVYSQEENLNSYYLQWAFNRLSKMILNTFPPLPKVKSYRYFNAYRPCNSTCNSVPLVGSVDYYYMDITIPECLPTFDMLFHLLKKNSITVSAYAHLLFYAYPRDFDSGVNILDFLSFVKEMITSVPQEDVVSGLAILYVVLFKRNSKFLSCFTEEVSLAFIIGDYRRLPPNNGFNKTVSALARHIFENYVDMRVLMNREPNIGKLMHAADMFEKKNVKAAFRAIQKTFRCTSQQPAEILYTGFAESFADQLLPPSNSGPVDVEASVKFLLECGLCRTVPNQPSHETCTVEISLADLKETFRNIVVSFVRCFDFLFEIVRRWSETHEEFIVSALLAFNLDDLSCRLFSTQPARAPDELEYRPPAPRCDFEDPDRPQRKLQREFAEHVFLDKFKIVTRLLVFFYDLNRRWSKLLRLQSMDGLVLVDDEIFGSSRVERVAWAFLADVWKSQSLRHPWWMVALVSKCQFLLSYDTRLSLYQRMAQVVVSQRDTVKLSMNRDFLLEHVERYFKLRPELGSQLWKFEFLNEIGKGDGVTKEFYSMFKEKIMDEDLNIWIKSSASGGNANGLYPSPKKGKHKLFFMLGFFMANAILQRHTMSIPLSRVFMKSIFSSYGQRGIADVDDLKCICPDHSNFIDGLVATIRHIKKLRASSEEFNEAMKKVTFEGMDFKDLSLDFTLPGYPDIEMMEDGRKVFLTQYNVDKYLELMIHWFVYEGPKRKLDHFRRGFRMLLDLSNLKYFYPEEAKYILCGTITVVWTEKELLDFCIYDNGYTAQSPPVQFLFRVLMSLNEKERSQFLQFATASSALPVGGLRSLFPQLTISCIKYEDADLYCPSASTCFNILFLPEYTCFEATRDKLIYAIMECSSFHLV